MKLKYILYASLLVLAVPVFAQEATTEPSMEAVVVEMPSIMPEGVEFDATNNRFLFGSLTQGTIFQTTDEGTAEPPRALMATSRGQAP